MYSLVLETSEVILLRIKSSEKLKYFLVAFIESNNYFVLCEML